MASPSPVAASVPAPAPVPAPAATGTPAFASGSLYVGDLHPDATEAQLFEIFKEIGPVASIRVCRDAITRRSLGYAYVNFHSYNDAERALDLLNHREIKGRPFRIMWSQRDPALRRTNAGNIFVKNLDKDIDDKALHDTFSAFGNILSCKVARDDKGNSKGFGFIHFDTQAAADEAVAKVNGMMLKDKVVFVGPFVPRKIRSDADSEKKWTNVYVKNVDKSIDDAAFKALFEPFGTITSAALSRDDNNESRGFGFVNFETHEAAEKAVEELNNKEIAGKQLYAGRAQKKSERERELRDRYDKLRLERLNKYQGVNLFVKNLDDTVDDARLRQEFSVCGNVTSAVVMKTDKGGSKGFGFVCFSDPAEATKAVTELNGTMLLNKPIYVALAQRKEQRRAVLEAQYANRAQSMRMQQVPGGPMFAGPGAPMFYNPNMQRFPQPGFPGGPMPRPRFQGQGGMPRPGFAGPVPPPGYVMQQMGPPMAGNGRGGMPRGVPRGGPVGGAPQRPAAAAAPAGVAGPAVPGAAPAQQAGYGIKYNANVRNFQQVPAADGAAAPAPDRKQLIGENLYPRILNVLRTQGQDDTLTGKVTGMFLESLDQEELMTLLEAPDALNKKVGEALEILQKHNQDAKANA
eukprot:TRINITY_DN31022_c0_g1_i1.p2 TRINITY_DN31022_c0_g1~~TRINITY_DN31022_c0_g1_i1.p2  ORF type:complete len:632 (-),score=276.63 TRINITY_DN31022_c0_g1_i1:273-2168(-)